MIYEILNVNYENKVLKIRTMIFKIYKFEFPKPET